MANFNPIVHELKSALSKELPTKKRIADLKHRIEDLKSEIDAHMRSVQYLEHLQQIKDQLIN